MKILFTYLINTLKNITGIGCMHNKGFRENRACNVICKSCGKDFGFIGNWQKSNPYKQADPDMD